MTDVTKS